MTYIQFILHFFSDDLERLQTRWKNHGGLGFSLRWLGDIGGGGSAIIAGGDSDICYIVSRSGGGNSGNSGNGGYASGTGTVISGCGAVDCGDGGRGDISGGSTDDNGIDNGGGGGGVGGGGGGGKTGSACLGDILNISDQH